MSHDALDRRTFFKGAGLAGAFIVSPSLLTACGGDGSGSGGGAVEFWWNPSVESSEAMLKWMEGVVADFAKQEDGGKVTSTSQPAEQMVSNFRTACQSKSGPDLQHQWSGPYTMQFVWEKCVSELDGVLDEGEFDHVLPPQALDLYRFRDKVWALPWYNAGTPLMYNKELFRQAGLDPETPPETWDEFLAAVKALRAKGITPWGYGVKNLTGIGNFSGLFNLQNLNDPKEILPVVLGEEKYTDPKFSEWLGWVKEMIDAKVFNPDVTSLEYQDAMNMFLAGKCAMAITSSLSKFHAELGDDLGVMAPPARGSGELAGRLQFGSQPLFITSFSEQKEQAAKFLAFLHRPEALKGMYDATGFFPADDRFDPTGLSTDQDKALWDILANKSMIGYQNYWPSKMDRENVFLAVQAVFSGTDPKQAAADVEKRLDGWRKASPNDVKNFTDWSQG